MLKLIFTTLCTLALLKGAVVNGQGTTEAADNSTTVEPTTVDANTTDATVTTDLTTPAITTDLTTESTVTTAAPPKRLNFTLDSNGKICFIMQAELSVQAMVNNVTKMFAVPADSSVNGQCQSPKFNNPHLNISWTEQDTSMELVFTFSRNSNNAEIKQVNFTMKNEVASTMKPLDLGISDKPFLCNAMLHRPLSGDFSAKLNINDLKVQAFGVNGTFSKGEAQECPEMQKSTTMAPSTTLAPSADVTVNVTDGGQTCLLLKGEMMFDLPYTDKKGKEQTAKVAFPSNFECTSCKCVNATVSNAQPLVLTFYSSWKLSMLFTMLEDKSVAMTNLSLTYKPADMSDKFPDIANATAAVTVSADHDNSRFKASEGGFYSCVDGISVKMGKATFQAKKFKVEAFRTSNKDFAGQEKECGADQVTDNIVPIAVGAALAALVVIVLIAYIIGRRRNRTGYQSV